MATISAMVVHVHHDPLVFVDDAFVSCSGCFCTMLTLFTCAAIYMMTGRGKYQDKGCKEDQESCAGDGAIKNGAGDGAIQDGAGYGHGDGDNADKGDTGDELGETLQIEASTADPAASNVDRRKLHSTLHAAVKGLTTSRSQIAALIFHS